MDRISFGISQTCWHDQTLVIVLFFSIHSSPSASRNWLRGTVLERFPLGLEDKPSFGWRENKSVSIILESLETHCSFSCIPSWIPDVFYGPSFFFQSPGAVVRFSCRTEDFQARCLCFELRLRV